MLGEASFGEGEAVGAAGVPRVAVGEACAGHGAHQVVETVAVGRLVPLDQAAVVKFVQVREGFVLAQTPHGGGSG